LKILSGIFWVFPTQYFNILVLPNMKVNIATCS
jgi:hypothetical protein